MEPGRLAVSTISTQNWTAWEDLIRYRALGIHGIGLWRDKLREVDLREYRKALDEHGMVVTNLCFAGQFTHGVEQAIQDGRHALEEATKLGASTVLVISGALGDTNLARAHSMVVEGLGRLAELADHYGIHLALEALHPMDMTAWTIIPTVDMALDIIDEVSHPSVGLMLDLYNSWWDPRLEGAIQRAGERILAVQMADWRNPTRSFTDRAVPGTGVADLSRLIRAVEATGYRGFYDLEIFSDEIWENRDGYSSVLSEVMQWWQGVPLNG